MVTAASYHVKLFDGPRLSGRRSERGKSIGGNAAAQFQRGADLGFGGFRHADDELAGTALAVIFSLPLSLVAAANISPHPVVYQMARAVLKRSPVDPRN